MSPWPAPTPDALFRVYDRARDAFTPDGYPAAWLEVKHLVREQAGNRCARCHHPYVKGGGEWTPCEPYCSHDGPRKVMPGGDVYARWRILTTHHLNGRKADLRWWNLVALCQRCHLTIQGKVVLERPYLLEHTDWFKPYAAAWYASSKLGVQLSREETLARLDELLALEHRQEALT